MIFETSASSSLFSATNNNHGYSSASTDEFDDAELTPTQLLSLAIRKRRELYDRKERDFRRELLHTGMVRRLCKALGDEGRAKRRRHRKSGRSRSRSASALGKRKLSEPTSSSYSTETGVAGIPLPPEPPVATESEPVQSFDVPPPPPPAEPMDDAPLAVNLSDDAAAAAAVADDDEQEPQPKRSKLDSDAMDEDDPFGLDAIFAGLYATEEHAVPNAFTSVIEPSRG